MAHKRRIFFWSATFLGLSITPIAIFTTQSEEPTTQNKTTKQQHKSQSRNSTDESFYKTAYAQHDHWDWDEHFYDSIYDPYFENYSYSPEEQIYFYSEDEF